MVNLLPVFIVTPFDVVTFSPMYLQDSEAEFFEYCFTLCKYMYLFL